MTAKTLLFHDQARAKLLAGMNVLADAVRAAVEEGVLPGGGVGLLRARVGTLHGANPDQDAGIRIVMRAVEEPLRQIAANSGDEPSVVVNRVAAGEGDFGYNALTGAYGDMVGMGILDPCKVTRTGLQNAASVAGLALATDCMIARVPAKNGASGAAGMND
jgi:chaperonin GroEL